MLKIYRDGGGKGGLGLEVERYEGIVREIGSEPVGLREMSENEKKVRDRANYPVRFFDLFFSGRPPLAFRGLVEFGTAPAPIHRLSFAFSHSDDGGPAAAPS
jgi:hypothetical protein